MLAQQGRRRSLRRDVDVPFERWILEDDKVPESRSHDQVADRICHLLARRLKEAGSTAAVGRNLAIRFDETHPRVGVDPDVYVLDPPPPESADLSLRLWETGHFPPRLAIEVVSTSRPDKDYSESPAKYAACGAGELWVFDPKLAGRGVGGGPHRLQLWCLRDDELRRVYAGEGPFFSPTMEGWVFAVDEGRSLSIADDEAGSRWWMTGEEAERAAKEAERAAKEAALRRVAELEARLAAAEKKG